MREPSRCVGGDGLVGYRYFQGDLSQPPVTAESSQVLLSIEQQQDALMRLRRLGAIRVQVSQNLIIKGSRITMKHRLRKLATARCQVLETAIMRLSRPQNRVVRSLGRICRQPNLHLLLATILRSRIQSQRAVRAPNLSRSRSQRHAVKGPMLRWWWVRQRARDSRSWPGER